MDALELLKTWPGWAKAGAEAILASPAWRMPVRLGEDSGLMRLVSESLSDTIDLNITLDDEPHILSLADSPRYTDLHLLWPKRRGLPTELLLALLEKECGEVFSMLEKCTRRLLGVKGLAVGPSADARFFEVETPSERISFALDLPPEIQTSFGRLEFLDAQHPSIRELVRTARVDYCSLMLTDEELNAMGPGDHLVIPEEFGNTQKWIVEPPSDEAVHLCSSDSREIAFGAFADDTLPVIPEPGALSLMLKNQRLHPCALSRVGAARTVILN